MLIVSLTFVGYSNIDFDASQTSVLLLNRIGTDLIPSNTPPKLDSPFDMIESLITTENPYGAVINTTSQQHLDELFEAYSSPGDFILLLNRENPNVNNQVITFKKALRQHHPTSNIKAIYYDKTTDPEQLLKKLQEETLTKDIVIAIAEFSPSMDQNITDFHNHLAQNVFNTFDSDAATKLDTNDHLGIETLMSYLKDKDAMNADIWGMESNPDHTSFFVNFHKGLPSENERDLTILAFGDVMLGRHVRTLMERNGLDYPFRAIAGPENRFLKGSDIVFANLEGPIRGQGSKGGTSMVFAFNQDIAPLLKSYGFNLLSISNNHTYDKGADGYNETVQTLNENEIGWCGDYHYANPDSVYYGTLSDTKYAFICVQDVTVRLDIDETVRLITEVKSNVDYLIVSAHWGNEYQHTPNTSKQIEPAHKFIDAGADLILGHHPHVAQTIEVYKDRYIFYSLGNFIFDQYFSTATQQGLAAGIVLSKGDDGELETKVYYFPMQSKNSQPDHMPENSRGWLPEYLKTLQQQT
jgi:poly-gamma-glutamate synthesis protein (capsule biosynthesis protein)